MLSQGRDSNRSNPTNPNLPLAAAAIAFLTILTLFQCFADFASCTLPFTSSEDGLYCIRAQAFLQMQPA